MKDLHFDVNGQRLTKANEEDFKHIVAKSKGYLRCMFSFDDEWAGTKKAVLFTTSIRFKPDVVQDVVQDIVRVDNVSCMVPDGVTDSNVFYVKIFGKRPGLVLQTNWIMIEQEV